MLPLFKTQMNEKAWALFSARRADEDSATGLIPEYITKQKNCCPQRVPWIDARKSDTKSAKTCQCCRRKRVCIRQISRRQQNKRVLQSQRATSADCQGVESIIKSPCGYNIYREK